MSRLSSPRRLVAAATILLGLALVSVLAWRPSPQLTGIPDVQLEGVAWQPWR